jgi:hypothetical protein
MALTPRNHGVSEFHTGSRLKDQILKGGPEMAATPTFVAAARERVRNQLGAELAQKASDAFCLVFGRETPGAILGLEAAGEAAVPPVATILEFRQEPDLVEAAYGEVRKTVEELRGVLERAGATQRGLRASELARPSQARRAGRHAEPRDRQLPGRGRLW